MRIGNWNISVRLCVDMTKKDSAQHTTMGISAICMLLSELFRYFSSFPAIREMA